jgi:hypothetical protein
VVRPDNPEDREMKTLFAILLICLTSFAFAEEDVNPAVYEAEALGEEEADEREEEGTFTVRYTADDNTGILDSSDEESEEGEEQPE